MPGSLLAAGPLDPQALLSKFGVWAVLVVVFAETGLPVIGVFLPGDTLLLPAGLLCSPDTLGPVRFSLAPVLLCAAAGSVAGAQTGYWLGRRGGRSARDRWREGSSGARMARAERLFIRYGPRRAVVLGRFVPVVRTLVHPTAGLLGMPAGTFTVWQAAAGIAWSQSLVLAGYALGDSGQQGESYLVPAIAAVIALSLVPGAVQWYRSRRAARRPGAAPGAVPPPRAGDSGQPAAGGRTEPQ